MEGAMSHLKMGLIATVLIAAGCGGDVNERSEDVSSVRQEEVAACPVSTSGVKFDREMVITAIDVVNDPCRTKWSGCGDTTKQAKWTFAYLMQQMAGSTHPSTFILKWLESFEETPSVNGQSLQARSKVRTDIINPWRAASGCSTAGNPKVDASPCLTLDFAKAPFRLLAIVNRMDLRSENAQIFYGGGSAGEGRFVFGVTKQDGTPLDATVILEYELPTSTWSTLTWAQKWHALGALTAPSAAYNDKLQEITDMFVKSGAIPAKANFGNAINQVRTNEKAFDGSASPIFELREHKLQCRTGISCSANEKVLAPTTLAQTPKNSLDMTPELRTYMNNNMSAILGGTHVVSGTMLTGASRPLDMITNPFRVWMADSPLDPVPPPSTEGDVRRLFGFSTCNGCHSLETDTDNFHIAPRASGAASQLSSFMSTAMNPITVVEPLEGKSINYNEPARRMCEFVWLLNGNGTVLTAGSGRPH
jgi:hypothetical protein